METGFAYQNRKREESLHSAFQFTRLQDLGRLKVLRNTDNADEDGFNPSFPRHPWLIMLEGKLPRKLEDTLIERRIDLAKIRVVDVQRRRQ